MPKKNRKYIPIEIRRKLHVYCRHECCICDCRIGNNDIHHINSDPSDDRYENLILLCPNCHREVHAGTFDEKDLFLYKDSKIKKVGNKKVQDETNIPQEDFGQIFSLKIDNIVKYLEIKQYDPALSDKIDELIMLLKEQIEKWDVPSVKFGTKELFLKLYQYSGDGDKLINLYVIYKDLFSLAYSQRKHILGKMIDEFYSIWVETWTTDYDIERAEKCCDILLRLGIDFVDKDLTIVESCFYRLDNAAGDMFEPEILSREILLGAIIEARINGKERDELLKTVIQYIQANDIYSHGDEKYDYLIDGIEYAERIQDNYGIDITPFKEKHLLKLIEMNKNETVESFVDFLTSDSFDIEKDDYGIENSGRELESIILSYGKLYPHIHNDIFSRLIENNDEKVTDYLNTIIDSRNYLKYLFKGKEMITSVNELIKFLENNSHFEADEMGLGFWGDITIYFKYPLKDGEKRALKSILGEYKITDSFDFEIDENCIMFCVDQLIHRKGKDGFMKFTNLLAKINECVQISNISTGIEFRFK